MWQPCIFCMGKFFENEINYALHHESIETEESRLKNHQLKGMCKFYYLRGMLEHVAT